MDTKNPITEAARIAGSYTNLAKALQVTPQAVKKYERLWTSGNSRAVPAHRAVQIEAAVGIPRYVLRPDLWHATEAA